MKKKTFAKSAFSAIWIDPNKVNNEMIMKYTVSHNKINRMQPIHEKSEETIIFLFIYSKNEIVFIFQYFCLFKLIVTKYDTSTVDTM